MFNNIVESVLNEISAEDAYNKFYNVIPRESFDKLIAAYGGKFDNLIKAILNNLKECINPDKFNEMFSKALKFINDYKSSPNEVRIRFNQNFKNGEYSDIYDFEQGIYELNANGVDTLKSIQKLGLITLLDDDNFRITCTTTYESSHHFYGKSRWCTASDRLGQYDGWIYFISYIFDLDSDEVEEMYDELLEKKGEIVACLVQVTNKKEQKMYQIQIFGENGMPGQICDSEDDSCSIDEIGLPEDLMDILQSSAKDLVERTKQGFSKEYNYQRSKDKYIKEKRERINIKRRELIEKYEEEIQAESDKKEAFIEKNFNDLIESKLLTNPEFLQQLIRNSDKINKLGDSWSQSLTETEINEYENILKQMKYAIVEQIIPSTNGLVVIKIRPAIGETYKITYGQGNIMPSKVKCFVTENMWYDTCLKGSLAIIAKTENESAEFDEIEISKIIKMTKDSYNNIYTLYQELIQMANYTNGGELMRYIIIQHIPLSGFGNCELFDSKTFKSVTVNGIIHGAILYGDYLLIMLKALGNPFIVLNSNTLEPIASLRSSLVDPLSYGWRIARNDKDNTLFILCDKMIEIGKKFTDVRFSDICVDYEPRLKMFTIVPFSKEKAFSTIICDYDTGKIKYENVNFIRTLSPDYSRNLYFAETENGEKIGLTRPNFK